MDGMALLRAALAMVPAARTWAVMADVRLLRLNRRIDAVVAAPGAVLAIRFAIRFTAADRLAIEDAALDLADFHAGCRSMPVIPILLVPNGAQPRGARPLPLAGAATVVETSRLLLPGLLWEIAQHYPPVPDGPPPGAWAAAQYRPVPALMEAACLMYARHDVVALTLAQAGRGGLAAASAAVGAAVQDARAEGRHVVVFVTGDPGAGKTLCGLDTAFAGQGAAFLTGNPTLVHVLRAALVRDAAARGRSRRAAQQRMEGVIQALPRFRDHHLADHAPPPERMLVIDEAQRCWTAAHASARTRTNAVPLTRSEPAHLMDIMERHDGWAAIVCLVGGGQEIHDGEGGLAEWGRALQERPAWHGVASGTAMHAADPRQRLMPSTKLVLDDRLHLGIPVRAVHAPAAARWADAMLAGDIGAARSLAPTGAPHITRSLHAMRRALRGCGRRQAGLVASAHARRLRAEGLGAVLPHQDADAVARWFLDPWPDLRSAGALEVVASEFGIQGLELDRVGVCWDADLVRVAPDVRLGGGGAEAWQACSLRGAAWTVMRQPASLSNRLNVYRVLLTRARFGTVIWVPHGDAADPTRDPRLYDGVAAYLQACGAMPLDCTHQDMEDTGMADPVLL